MNATTVVVVVGSVVGGFLLAGLLAAASFEIQLRRDVAEVRSAGTAKSDKQAKTLPDVVQAYAKQHVAKTEARDTAQNFTAVRLKQVGRIRLGEDEPWVCFTATQYMSALTPGFIWIASAPALPIGKVTVVDAFVRGKGRLDVRAFGALPVARTTGPVADEAELQRYLAELPLVPQSFTKNRSLTWSKHSKDRMRVQAAVGGKATHVDFTLNEDGDITQVHSESRGRQVGRDVIPTSWTGFFEDYRTFDGHRIPTKAKVQWNLEGRTFVYWQATITEWGRVSEVTDDQAIELSVPKTTDCPNPT